MALVCPKVGRVDGKGKHRVKMLLRAETQLRQPGKGEREFESGLSRLGVVYRTQRVLGQWIADFVVPSMKLVIEVDGPDHLEKLEKDARRDRALGKMGWTVARVSSSYAKEHPLRAAAAVISGHLGDEKWAAFLRSRETDLLVLRGALPEATTSVQSVTKHHGKVATWDKAKSSARLRATKASRRIEAHHRSKRAQVKGQAPSALPADQDPGLAPTGPTMDVFAKPLPSD